jgi:hypothetical protein
MNAGTLLGYVKYTLLGGGRAGVGVLLLGTPADILINHTTTAVDTTLIH